MGTRIQSKIIAFLKQHPGETFTPRQIADAIGNESKEISGSCNTAHRNHPRVVLRVPIGKTGRLAQFGYRKSGAPSAPIHDRVRDDEQHAARTVQAHRGMQGASILLPVEVAVARRLYEQLKQVFGSK